MPSVYISRHGDADPKSLEWSSNVLGFVHVVLEPRSLQLADGLVELTPGLSRHEEAAERQPALVAQSAGRHGGAARLVEVEEVEHGREVLSFVWLWIYSSPFGRATRPIIARTAFSPAMVIL